MLEYHSRLHHLDVKRQRQQQRKQEAAAAAAAAARPSGSSSSSASGPFTVQHPVLEHAGVDTTAAGHHQEAAGLESEHEAAEQLGDGGCSDAASDVQVRA
jgi:hypothetical protein